METLLWALNLGALVALCLWALRQDDARPPSKPPRRDR